MHRHARTIGLAACALALAGCSTTRPTPRITWPPPPARPMVAYAGSISGSRDLGRSVWGRLRDFFLGAAPEQSLNKPYGLAWDGASRLYVTDTGTKRVLIVDLDAGQIRSFSSLGVHGTLREPVGVLPDGDDVYVSDTGLSRIAVFDPEGNFRRFVGAEGDLDGPVGMALAGEPRRLFVTDTRLHEVRVFDRDGRMVSRFGGRGEERGQFYHPLGIATGGGDTLYVVDSFHFAVQAFDLDGRYLFSFGHRPGGVGTMARPRAIAMDSDRHLYVTDALSHNVQVYGRGGDLLFRFGAEGVDPGRFRLPAGICITRDDRIYVVDSINQRIQEFAYVGGSAN